MLEHVGIQPSPPLIHWDNSLSGSNKVFHLKIALKLALGEYWLLLARWCPVSTFSYLRGKAFLGKLAKSPSSKGMTYTHGSNLDGRL